MKSRDVFPSLLTRRTRWLTHLLIFSVTINVALLATLSYLGLRTRGAKECVRSKAVRSSSLTVLPQKLSAVLTRNLSLSFEELVALLEDETHVEQGQLACDLALACLVACHNFSMERALTFPWQQTRDYAFLHPVTKKYVAVTLFAGLTEDQRKAVRLFARQEKWPLTAKGLFFAMQKAQNDLPMDLKRTFFLSKEFYAIYRVVKDTAHEVEQEEVLASLLKIDWPAVATVVQDLECESGWEEKRERLLQFWTELFDRGHFQAGLMAFAMDPERTLRCFDDRQLAQLMDCFDGFTFEVEKFLRDLEASLRADALREQARAVRLALRGRQQPLLAMGGSQQEVKAPVVTAYAIQFGDTLWKISRRVGVSVALLKKFNELDSDVLIPGKVLLIPKTERQGTGS